MVKIHFYFFILTKILRFWQQQMKFWRTTLDLIPKFEINARTKCEVCIQDTQLRKII